MHAADKKPQSRSAFFHCRVNDGLNVDTALEEFV
jgi:hypothetical protein